jgi:UDP-glucose 4-epimerase
LALAEDNKRSRHLILGGTGFIGRHVALYLAELGFRVSIASRRPPKIAYSKSVSDLISWVEFDMTTANWATLLRNVDVLHHYAWSTVPSSANADPGADLALNLAPTVALLEEMRRTTAPPRLIFSSSGGTVYGKLHRIPASETHEIAPITAYGASKAAVEHYLGYYRAVHGLDCLVARIANPFGAGQNFGRGQGAATTFLAKAISREPISIYGDGNTIRDYIHITDVAAGLAALALSPRNMGGSWRFNIASGQGVSLNQIVTELERLLSRRLMVHREPGRAFDVPVSILDISLARNELAWSPQLSFSEGVAQTLHDFETGGNLSRVDIRGLRRSSEFVTSDMGKIGPNVAGTPRIGNDGDQMNRRAHHGNLRGDGRTSRDQMPEDAGRAGVAV